MTTQELEARASEIKADLKSLQTEAIDRDFTPEERSKWNDLGEEEEKVAKSLEERHAREAVVASLDGDSQSTEPEREVSRFNTRKAGAPVGEEIYDLSTIRNSLGDPEATTRDLQERAKRALDDALILDPNAPQEDGSAAKARIARLLATRDEGGDLSKRMILTGSKAYFRAFSKSLAGSPLTNEESVLLSRAMSLTTTKGGFAVPYILDPTVILTSNGVVNPMRQLADVEQITVDTWKGIATAGITAAYHKELEEVEETPVEFSQPEISSERADVLILASFEITQDWTGIQAQVARIIADAKDTLEATKFLTGTGTDEPYGLLTGATETVTSGTTEAFGVADVYALQAALPPRYVANASWLANAIIFGKVRQFDTQGGANLWTQLSYETPATLLGKPVYEMSTMNSEIKANKLNLVYGDIRRAYKIIERIGMGIEVIQHVMNGKKATGARGFYAFWRNSGKVIDKNAVRVLKGK